MRKIIYFIAFIAFAGCTIDTDPAPSDDTSSTTSGLLQFSPLPVYEKGVVKFGATNQAGPVGGVTAEFRISEISGTMVKEGVIVLDEDIGGGLGHFYSSKELVEVPIDTTIYEGKKLIVHLDPDNKLTSAEYQTEFYLKAYRVDTVFIPDDNNTHGLVRYDIPPSLGFRKDTVEFLPSIRFSGANPQKLYLVYILSTEAGTEIVRDSLLMDYSTDNRTFYPNNGSKVGLKIDTVTYSGQKLYLELDPDLVRTPQTNLLSESSRNTYRRKQFNVR